MSIDQVQQMEQFMDVCLVGQNKCLQALPIYCSYMNFSGGEICELVTSIFFQKVIELFQSVFTLFIHLSIYVQFLAIFFGVLILVPSSIFGSFFIRSMNGFFVAFHHVCVVKIGHYGCYGMFQSFLRMGFLPLVWLICQLFHSLQSFYVLKFYVRMSVFILLE